MSGPSTVFRTLRVKRNMLPRPNDRFWDGSDYYFDAPVLTMNTLHSDVYLFIAYKFRSALY